MSEKEFNLLDEPWIRVRLPDCSVQEVNFREALMNAQNYVDLAGETPPQDVAVLRLLLAVLHTVFSRVDETGAPSPIRTTDQALQRWNALWSAGALPEKPINDYLNTQHERFWLFHPQYPFWQVPEAAIGTAYEASKLNGEISESSNKRRIFTLYAGAGKDRLSYSQAARWLLYVNGYDDTSAKPKGKGLPSVGAGWLGKIGLITAQGENLFETLLLNLTFLKDGETLWGPEVPCWELNPPRSGERTEIPQPDNQAQLLTLQSRRLLLHRENGAVTGYSLLGGDFFQKENAFSEQMTIWRGTSAGKDAPVVYQPRRHDPSRQFWREFPVMFADEGGGHRPGIVSWLTRLQSTRVLDRKRMIRFAIAGVEYGDKDFFITDSFSDALTFHLGLLETMSKRWRSDITHEIGRCDQLANCLGDLAKGLAWAQGDLESSGAATVKEQFYFRLDQPFRLWLACIDPSWDEEERQKSITDWHKTILRLAREQGEDMVKQAGPVAFAGRSVSQTIGKGKNEKTVTVHYSAPEAFNRFLYAIHKAAEE